MTKQLAFHVNLANCTGCKACQIACKDKNDLPAGVVWRHVFEYSGGEWIADGDQMLPSNVFTYYVSTACMHCQQPLCVEICPTGAMTKNADGVVAIDQSQCVGCRYCGWACPYGAPQFNEASGTMTKCNFCADLLAKGQRPACVDACPYRAIDFGPIEEMRAKYGTLVNPAPLPDPALTTPSIVYTPHAKAQTSINPTGQLMNIEEVMK